LAGYGIGTFKGLRHVFIDMPHDELLDEPILKPRVIRALRKRPKLFNLKTREKVLEHLEEQVVQRRTPGRVAERVAHRSMQTASEAATPVVRETVQDRIEQANESVLKGL